MEIENKTRWSRDKTIGFRPGRAEMRPCGAEETSVKKTRSTGSSVAWESGREATPQPWRWHMVGKPSGEVPEHPRP